MIEIPSARVCSNRWDWSGRLMGLETHISVSKCRRTYFEFLERIRKLDLNLKENYIGLDVSWLSDVNIQLRLVAGYIKVNKTKMLHISRVYVCVMQHAYFKKLSHPHWSKLLISHITPWMKILCSYIAVKQVDRSTRVHRKEERGSQAVVFFPLNQSKRNFT